MRTQKTTKKQRKTQKSISDGTLCAPWARFGRSRGAHGHFLDLWGALGELLNVLGALLDRLDRPGAVPGALLAALVVPKVISKRSFC